MTATYNNSACNQNHRMKLKPTHLLIPVIIVLLFASAIAPNLANAADQPDQPKLPTITTTVENSFGTYIETKPYVENSFPIESSGTASAITLTSSASTSALPYLPPPSALSNPIVQMVIAGLIVGLTLWAITPYLDDMRARRRQKLRTPPPGIVVGIPSVK